MCLRSVCKQPGILSLLSVFYGLRLTLIGFDGVERKGSTNACVCRQEIASLLQYFAHKSRTNKLQ